MGRKREIAVLNAPKRIGGEDHPGAVSFLEPNETDERTVAHGMTRPQNPIEALMQCAPFQDPDTSRDELAHLRDIIQDAIDDALDDRERWVFDGLYSRRASSREVGRELSLSKSHVLNIRDRALLKLRTRLIESPEVRRYLGAE